MSGYFRGRLKRKEGEGEIAANVTDQPPSTSSAVGPSLSQTQPSESKVSFGSKMKAKFGGVISRGATPPPTQPPTSMLKPSTSDAGDKNKALSNVVYYPEPGTLLSKRVDIPLGGSEQTNQKKVALLELGIGAIDTFSEIADVAGIALPNPVGIVLKKVSSILGILKQMMENQTAWDELLRTIDGHQQIFNDQLRRLEAESLVPDPNSPFIGPIKQYSLTLEKIMADIMKETALAERNAIPRSSWEKFTNFSSKFMNAGSEQAQMQSYIGKLSSAMEDFKKVNFDLYMGFMLHQLKRTVDDVYQKLNELSESNEETVLLAELKSMALKASSSSEGCMEGTREDILGRINNWTIDANAPNILWVKGHPGVGKSAIATNIAEQLREMRRLGSSFFFQRQKADAMTPHTLWCTVAYDLARRYPSIRKNLVAKIKADEISPTTPNLDSLFRNFIHEPLSHDDDIPSARLPVIIIDALDECGGLEGSHSANRKALIRTLKSWACLPGKFKLIVTSRGEKDIDLLFSTTNHHAVEIMAGESVSTRSSEDIRTFLTVRLQEIAAEYPSLPLDWPGLIIIDQLTQKAGGLFIWAETVVKFIAPEEPLHGLSQVLNGAGTSDVEALYEQILKTSFRQPSEELISNFRSVVGTIILAKAPISSTSLARLLSTTETTVEHICNRIQSVLGSKGVFKFHHQSFVDFLLNGRRCPPDFLIHPKREHRILALACLRTMNEELRFNIGGVKSSYLRNVDIPDLASRVKGHILYSSCHWVNHLAENEFDLDTFGHVQSFMNKQFLSWLEVLSITGRVNLGSRILSSLIDWIPVHGQEEAMAMAREMQKFIAIFASAISWSAPHIYISALPFIPPSSALSKRYRDRYPKVIRIRVGGLPSWPLIQNVLSGHSGSVQSVAISPDGKRIVSGSSDSTVRLWDAETGQALADPLRGHSGLVYSVAYSPDGKRVVSGSGDNTIRLWEAETGRALADPLPGHSHCVRSVAFSPDGKRIVSGSEDSMVRLWDAEMGQAISDPLRGHTGHVFSVTYSPDGNRIASGSEDTTIRLWDAETGASIADPLRGHRDWVLSVAFSPDGKRIVSGSRDKTIRLWDAKTGQALADPLRGHSSWVRSVTFSPDGSRIVSGSSDSKIRLWDARTGQALAEPLLGHSDWVQSVAFSPDGKRIVSGSEDKTIRLWDAETGQAFADSVRGHSGWVLSVSFSSDGNRIVSCSADNTICLWDARTGRALADPLQGHTNLVWSVAFSPDGKRIVSGSFDKTIRLWDAETGQPLAKPLRGHSNWVRSVAFSPDGKSIVSSSEDKTIRLWDTETGQALAEPLQGHNGPVLSLAFSPDGRRIVSGSSDKTIRLWDAKTGHALAEPFRGHSGQVFSVAFSPDGTHIVSGSDDTTIRLWDAETGQAVADPLRDHSGKVFSVAFSPDGKRIVSGSSDKTIRLWDEKGRSLADPLRGHSGPVQSVAFSPDGMLIVSGSEDKAIRLWDAETGQVSSDPPQGHDGLVRSVSFSSDGNGTASGVGDNVVQYSGASINQTTTSFNDSSKLEDGWVLGQHSEPLFWLPAALRAGLWWPRNTLVIEGMSTRLDLTSFAHGDSWTCCKAEEP